MASKIFNILFKNKVFGNIMIILSSIFLVYLICSIYFINHFFIKTKVNGVNLSIKNYNEADELIEEYINNYSIEIIGRDGRREIIDGKDIGVISIKKDIKSEIQRKQNSFIWIKSVLSKEEYYIDGLIHYDKDKLENAIDNLGIITKDIEEPINVGFKYSNEGYEIVPELYGNKINKNKLIEILSKSISKGVTLIDLEENEVYYNPVFTSNSEKAKETKDLLNKYISTEIIYLFGNKKEVLDGSIIKEWLSVNENLDVIINEKGLNEYITSLGKKYNTVGISRKFKTSTGKEIDVEGGYYGWKINSTAEKKLLNEYIKLGASIEKEPTYSQEALYRETNDIGNTYVEINISRQYLWFYKDGKVIAEGSVVTGDKNNGYSTTLGTYMINYKQKEATLRGPGYEAKVKYWMPFNGNIGIHDASWRSSFGHDIYEHNGTHGCVNSPLYLAKTIYDNIEAGIPVICYEE